MVRLHPWNSVEYIVIAVRSILTQSVALDRVLYMGQIELF